MTSDKVIFKRAINLALPSDQSAFLWGPRKTGKTFYLKSKFPDNLRYNLLESDTFTRLSKEPHRLREELRALGSRAREKHVIIDEVQKIPALLDEIQLLMEEDGLSFILCGSSARKLKRVGANLLGGRAWRFQLFPLTTREVENLDLLRAFNNGLIPRHYLSASPRKTLEAYVFDYLKEEIRAEGLSRNIPAFSRFLDAIAFSNTQMVNYANISRDCGVDAKTVKEYCQILVDTLLGYLVYPFKKRVGREIITATPKFYFFDTGIPTALTKSTSNTLAGEWPGKLFENFILMELMAYRHYRERDFDLTYWRTKTDLEVDFILDGKVAVETTISGRVGKSELKGIKAFCEEHPGTASYLVCNEPRSRQIPLTGNLTTCCCPWRDFLDRLWAGEVL